MTLEIAVVLLILTGAAVLFVTGWIRMDLVALMVLVAVAATGYVTPAEALSGFSNPAVVTVWAMFIVSGGLTLTGVADWVSVRLLRVSGTSEQRLIVTIMLAAGLLSTVILSNTAVAAMMLPIVIEMARRTGHAPSRLLLPMALGCLLGGLTTMIGTPPTILVAEATQEFGLPPFRLFSITPVGVVALLAGVVFVAIIGRHLLPRRDPLGDADGRDPAAMFELDERLLEITIPNGSPLAGRTLASARLGAALNLTVLAVTRGGRTLPAPNKDTMLFAGDRLLALGRLDLIDEARRLAHLASADATGTRQLDLVEAKVLSESPLVDGSLLQTRVREQVGLTVLGVRRGPEGRMGDLADWRTEVGDVLLLAAVEEPAARIERAQGLTMLGPPSTEVRRKVYQLDESIVAVTVPPDSPLAGRTLAESRLRDRLGLAVWEIQRGDTTITLPGPDQRLEVGDVLMAYASVAALELLAALGSLDIDTEVEQDLSAIESVDVGLAGIVLSPQTTLEGKTLRELEFRHRYGLSVLAIWRQGRAYRTGLRDLELRFGDAILAHGPRDQLRLLSTDPEFVVASEPSPPPPRREKAPIAVAVLAGIAVSVATGWMPIAVVAVAGAVVMVLTRCLTMEDAYRFIEWQAVFLIAGMIPLGLAIDQTGAAAFIASGMVSMLGGIGPIAVLGGIYLLTSLITQIMPAAALVVIMAPIAYTAAIDLGVSPLPFLMTLAIAASASFSSPVAHPANTLVMGPGGYRFGDYVKVGIPVTGVVFTVTLIMVPMLWPF